MNARKKIADFLWWSVPSSDDAEAKARAGEMLDAFAAEVRTAALNEGADAIVNSLRREGYDLDCVCDSCTPCLLRDYPDMLRRMAAAGQAPAPKSSATALLATPCDACDHTLNWHRNDIGCTIPRCVCGRFQSTADGCPVPETAPDAEGASRD